MRPLTDRVVLITGASRGLGVDMCQALAAHGAKLALVARSADDLEKVRAGLGSTRAATAFPADLGDARALGDLVARVEQALGPIDVLVNNAGIEHICDFEDMPLEDLERVIRVNVTGLLLLTRLVAPGMVRRRSGHIVNISSMAGLMPVPHNAVYSCSKHAVVGFSRSLRLELADHNVGVSVVCPGFVEGGMFLKWERKPPSAAGWVSSPAVAAATVQAILRNRAEVKVSPALSRLGPILHTLSPRLSGASLRAFGVVGYMRDQAKIDAERRRRGS